MSKDKLPSIAIVSLSGVFPKAVDCEQFWRNICQKVDASISVPRHRWASPLQWVSSKTFETDKAYSHRACLIDTYDFDPKGFQIEPDLLIELDPLFQWVLSASRSALEQTHIDSVDLGRIGVIIAAIALPTDTTAAITRYAFSDQLHSDGIHTDRTDLPSPGEAISGRVVGMPASIISQSLGLGGTNYTLDAACASSLYAIKLACDELQAHRSDAMITGGVSRPDCLYTQIGFSQLRALSRSGRCAPFDRSADGLVVGEGAGIMVLKRLDDAIAHGDKIYGVIRGIGISNDMRGNLLAPESAGQLRAMRAAYAQAGWTPQDVDYIECHGTGTLMGDTTELQSLRKLWGEDGWQKGQCAIGSVKSMIGHLLTAAGAAGMIKTLMGLTHKIIPPSLNFGSPATDSPLIDGPFKVQTDTAQWPEKGDGASRKAAVSAFGFGGINAHVLLEEWRGTGESGDRPHLIEVQEPSPESTKTADIAIVGMDLRLGAIKSVSDFQHAIFNFVSALNQPPLTRWRAPAYAGRHVSARQQGNFIDKVSLGIGEFQIPPGEIPDILPQQLLMLKVAAGAMSDAGLPLRKTRERMGTIIGIGCDYESSNFHLRWALPNLVEQWKNGVALPSDPEELKRWLLDAKERCGPPLTATRVLGALGGIVASRIAREFRFGGPSFVVSAEEASGLKAVEIARRMLQADEIDTMLVGAVDLNCDERNMATLFQRIGLSKKSVVRPFDTEADGTLPGEGAVALVLKRLEDAEADNDRIYARIEGVGCAGGGDNDRLLPGETVYVKSLERAFKDAQVEAERIDTMECHGSGVPHQDQVEAAALHQFFNDKKPHGAPDRSAVGTTKPLVGHTGVTSGLASLAKSVLGLYHQIIAPVGHFQKPSQTQWAKGVFHFPNQAAYWARNRADGPRKACVAAMTSAGQCMHVVLGQVESPHQISTRSGDPYRRPMGPLPYGLFVVKGKDHTHLMDNLSRLEYLVTEKQSETDADMESIARRWWHSQQAAQTDSETTARYSVSLAVVSGTKKDLLSSLNTARKAVEAGRDLNLSGHGGVVYYPEAARRKGQIAFVYPGSGNHYIGMGRSLGVHWPEVLRDMNDTTDLFKSQLQPQWYDPWRVDWSEGWTHEAYADLVSDPLRTIFGQVVFGGQMTGLLKKFGLTPDAVIGYSLGESAGLFAMGAWTDRGAMLERLERSDLFKTQLTGRCEVVRKAWQVPANHSFDWKVAAVNRDPGAVDLAIADLGYVRRLIVNTPEQCVIGGHGEQVETAIAMMKCTAVYLDGVVTVHCDAAKPAAAAYHDLHRFHTTPIPNVRFYSCAHEKVIDLTSETAAASITAQAVDGFNFPNTIDQAYADGVRTFIEVGPHCSCTRMIGDILTDKPHLAVSANHRSEPEPLSLLKCLATVAAAGVDIDLDPLYGYAENHFETASPDSPTAIDVPVGGEPYAMRLPAQAPPKTSTPSVGHGTRPKTPAQPKASQPPTTSKVAPETQPALDMGNLIDKLNANVAETAKAHEQFLELSQDLTNQYAKTFDWQNQLMSSAGPDAHLSEPPGDAAFDKTEAIMTPPIPAVAFDRSQCMEFAIGSVGKMLGPEFDIIDSFKARVRLPDDPLMLVDRIISVEGEKLSLTSGRVVTEHDVLTDAWYLDGNRAPVCISVEAGQADLFLSAYLGIDHEVKGERTYRLLDAKVQFHRGLPQPGETIRYDIRIDKFVRQEETYLFFFRFEGFIGDQKLITMTDGCAGFFTEEEVRNSGGIILTDKDKSIDQTIDGEPYSPLLKLSAASYDDAQVDALRRGDAGDCFGSQFRGVTLPPSLRLPGGRMRLIHRIVSLDPMGGRFGKGSVKAEADIHPEDWFLTCHFVDDMVMPGTLMYECCAHTLRALLLRLGWVTDNPDACYEPIQNIKCCLKCRGPVTPSTQRVHYEVEIKEIGYRPEPYVIADAHMYADGHYIVFFKDMTLQMTGVAREDIHRFWQQRSSGDPISTTHPHQEKGEAIFTRQHILEFAIGSPSKAYGDRYAPFDHDRVIARLPGPPYCFIDRVTSIDHAQWALKPAGWVEAQFDIPADAWFFGANRSGAMPFCVLLEIALQPCGWLAAYSGSALKSKSDLKFRNLGGKGVLHTNIHPADQTLTMRTRMTKVSEAADMIIENFDFEVLAGNQMVYEGSTYFGFFTAGALEKQVGLRESTYVPSSKDLSRQIQHRFENRVPLTPDDTPEGIVFQPTGLAMPGKALCMIDGVDIHCPDGGPHGLGYLQAFKIIDPEEWYFKAHFYQDPVCPGSLGVESFLQVIKFAAIERWPELIYSHRFEPVCATQHQWSYRGQIIPTNRKVIVETHITSVEEGPTPVIMADGALQVDGVYIYKLEGFGLRLVPLK